MRLHSFVFCCGHLTVWPLLTASLGPFVSSLVEGLDALALLWVVILSAWSLFEGSPFAGFLSKEFLSEECLY